MSLIKHYYGYLEEYITLTHSRYAKSSGAVFTTYFTLDPPNCVYDENYMAAYEDVGDASGLRWNKISLFPVFFGEASNPSINANETGSVRAESIRPFVVVPNMSDMTPKIGDFIRFTNLEGETLTYTVINIDYTMPNQRTHYKLALAPAHHKDIEGELDAQITGRYVYNDVLDILLEEQLGLAMLKVTNAIYDIDNKLFNNFYNERLDGLVSNNILMLNFNYYVKLINDNFPTKKVKLHSLNQSDFIENDASSIFNLLYGDNFTETNYSLQNQDVDDSDLSIQLLRRFKTLKNYFIKNTGGTETIFDGFIDNTDEADMIQAFDDLLAYRLSGTYVQRATTVLLSKYIYQLIDFLENQTVPQQFDVEYNNILELLMLQNLAKHYCEYALTQKVTDL